MPAFSRQVIDGCTRAAHGSKYIVNKQVTREDSEAAVQGSQYGEIQTKTVVAIVGAIGAPSLPCPLRWPSRLGWFLESFLSPTHKWFPA
ncbi:hypothetical protein PISMIDRAFT_688205 [Pisolithus microcarpus 441]|uniref:Uncharacterized protein n=1 Tax=Pisolithus microcarpus 441 TaxID=765257 RepID=A0A0C9XP02_9AGAM|nr:hypothetical protein PISMIDRAFT_688205 [Pisolithus microcarpus 441]